jgi:hypothetical protein
MLAWLWLLAAAFAFAALLVAADVFLIRRGRKSVSRWCLEHPAWALPVAGAALFAWGVLTGHLFFPQVVYLPGP